MITTPWKVYEYLSPEAAFEYLIAYELISEEDEKSGKEILEQIGIFKKRGTLYTETIRGLIKDFNVFVLQLIEEDAENGI